MVSVVIIDDEDDLTSVLNDFCEMKGVSVLGTGKNGKDAAELCEKHHPDYLLLDIAMPHFDGFYALEILQKTKNPVKIIIMSGLLDDQNKTKLEKYEIFALFNKPMNLNDMVNCMLNDS